MITVLPDSDASTSIRSYKLFIFSAQIIGAPQIKSSYSSTRGIGNESGSAFKFNVLKFTLNHKVLRSFRA